MSREKISPTPSQVTLDRYLRSKEVMRITGLSRTTIWRKERAGTFPARRRISQNAVGWLESEIMAWVAQPW
jgi:prophage regulatory protein